MGTTAKAVDIGCSNNVFEIIDNCITYYYACKNKQNKQKKLVNIL